MRYVKSTKSLLAIMEKALKRLDKDHIHYMIETEPAMSISKKRKSDEELYNISYLGKISELFTKTFLERAYFLDRWVFRLQCRECFGRNAA